MANMGYCRFKNTLSDLYDCEECMDDDELSASEKRARLRLISLCKKIAADYGTEVQSENEG